MRVKGQVFYICSNARHNTKEEPMKDISIYGKYYEYNHSPSKPELFIAKVRLIMYAVKVLWNSQFIFKPAGSAGTADPLYQRWTYALKFGAYKRDEACAK